MLLPDGSLDRKKVGALVFADSDARKKLELITHPRIAAGMLKRAGELEEQNEPLGCYEAALLIERGFAELCRPIVVVAASEKNQIGRAMKRDNLSEKDVRARLDAQLPLSAKIAAANYVIYNDGEIDALIAQADNVLETICAAAGIHIARYTKPAGP
jgi:dephospho-CoA kinase